MSQCCVFAGLTQPGKSYSDNEQFAMIKAPLKASANILNRGEFHEEIGGENSLAVRKKYFGKHASESVQHCLDPLGGKARIESWDMGRRVVDGFVRKGIIDGVALSEVNANTIRQAV
ncbi:hypothetical protein F5X99DRAFT_372169 [Biscogniauxia marginata]|nr:hypothetical protein F5X99DRAFT_372169 [Biscogniauxia marginata]